MENLELKRMHLIQVIILGVVQGIFEWLPVSSEGVITLTMTQLFGENALESVNFAIWLHLGTMFSALIYFRRDVKKILLGLPDYLKSFGNGNSKSSGVISFLIIATLLTSIIGGFLYIFGIKELATRPKIFTGLMGTALLLTGFIRFYSSSETRTKKDIDWKDSVFVGILQSFSIIPGVSRSGSTVFGLFYRRFKGKDAFKLSFLLSIPAVLVANIGIELFSGFTFSIELLYAALISFVIGYVFIHLLLKIADRVEIAYLCFLLAIITFATLLI